MKKLLLGTIILFLFGTSLIFIQLSCSKSLTAQTKEENNPLLLKQLGTLIYVKTIIQNPNSSVIDNQIWTADYDGSNQQKINIVLPEGYKIIETEPKLSPDGKKVFFVAAHWEGQYRALYLFSCERDGSDVAQVLTVSSSDFDYVRIGGAY